MKLTLLLFFSVFTAVAQSISGKILETETNEPIEFVNIYIEKIENGTTSNEKGEFNLKLNKKIKSRETIRFSKIGFTTISYTSSELEQLDFVVHLSKKTEKLSEVTVTSNKKLDSKVPYEKLSSIKKGIHHFGSAIVDNKIYVIGGDESLIIDTAKKVLNEVSMNPIAGMEDFIKEYRSNLSWERYSNKLQTYDIENDSWSISNLKFRKRAYHKTIYINNKLYVLGGKTLSPNQKFQYLDAKIEVFDLKTKEIVVDDMNPHQAINFAAVSYQDNIVVMGGSNKLKRNGEKIYSDKNHIYNITSGYWYELPQMTKPKEANGIMANEKIYLIGGSNDMPLTEIESYDLSSGKWKKEGDLFYGIENPALVYNNNIIYIFSSNKILTFHTTTKVLNEYKSGISEKDAQMYFHKEKLYILGGDVDFDFSNVPSSTLYVIDIKSFENTEILNSTTSLQKNNIQAIIN
jgi:hypothetical protein